MGIVNLGELPTVAEFGHELIHQQFDRIVRKERGVLADKDPEHLHQMRVSSRRLLASLQTFSNAIELPKLSRGRNLGALTKTLGRLRDLDVQIAMIRDEYYPQINLLEQKKLQKLLTTLRKQRSQAFTKTVAVLNHSSYRKLKDAYQNWLKNPKYTPIADLQLPLVLPELLSPSLSVLLIHPAWLISGADCLPSDIGDRSQVNSRSLHSLRKICKAVRYQTEFFALFYGLEFQNWIEELKQIQDILGNVQDTQVLRKLLATELGADINLPELEQAIQNGQEKSYESWELLRHNYLDFDFRHRLHQMILEPRWLNISKESIR